MPFQVFKCDFCEYLGSHASATQHEDECLHNPENRKCLSCSFYINPIENPTCVCNATFEKGTFVLPENHNKTFQYWPNDFECPDYEQK